MLDAGMPQQIQKADPDPHAAGGCKQVITVGPVNAQMGRIPSMPRAPGRGTAHMPGCQEASWRKMLKLYSKDVIRGW